MKEYAIIGLALLAVVFFSGCIYQPQQNVTATGGRISVSLNVTPLTAPKNTPISVVLTVSNKALFPIRDVEALLFGPVEWNLGEKKSVARIEPDGERIFTWNIRTSIPRSDYVHARVTYRVESNRSATYRVVKYGTPTKEKPGLVSSSISSDLGGPIRIEFEGDASYVYPDEEGRINIKILLTNRGDGRAYKVGGAPEQEKGLDQVDVYISAPGLTFSESSDNACKGTNPTVDLVGKTTGIIICEAAIRPNEVEILKDYIVTVTVKYNYYEEKTSPKITITER